MMLSILRGWQPKLKPASTRQAKASEPSRQSFSQLKARQNGEAAVVHMARAPLQSTHMVAEGDALLEDRISTCEKTIAALSSALTECNRTEAAPKAIRCLAQQVKRFDVQLLCVSLQLLPDGYSEAVMQIFCKRKAIAADVLEKAKAVVLEHHPAKFAATALGQILCSLHGVQIASFVMDTCSENSPSSELSDILQEFMEELLAYKAKMLRAHDTTLQTANVQAAKQAQSDAEAMKRLSGSLEKEKADVINITSRFAVLDQRHRSMQEQLKAKQASFDRLKRRHIGTVHYHHKRVSSMEAQHAAQMKEVVLVEARRRRDEGDQAQATATRLSAELEIALQGKDAAMEHAITAKKQAITAVEQATTANKQALAAKAEVQAGKREQQELKNLLENLLRTSVPSHRLEKAEQERDEASKLATAAQKQLAAAKTEAATAKTEAATAEAVAATASEQASTGKARATKKAAATKRKRKGKAAAAKQLVHSVANMVATEAPQPMFQSESEASIKAALAERAKQVQQLAAKDGGNKGWADGSLVSEVAELEGQGKAAAADQRVLSVANLVPKAAPKPMLKCNLEADLAEKAMQLKQVAAKDGCYEDTAHKYLLREVAKLEGQAAHVHFMHKGQIMAEGNCSHTLLEDTATLASCDFDAQARLKYEAATWKEQAGSWKWVASPFSRAVRTLAPSQAVAAHLGKGAMSLGLVQYAEVLLANGHIVPCALKKLPYGNCSEAQVKPNAELAALRDAEGCPHLAQCYGAFERWCPEEKQRCLWLVMEYAEGLSFQEAYRQLHKLDSEAEYPDMHFTASKLLMQHVLKGLEWLHKRGRAFCDLKPDNIRVQMGQQPGTFAHVTLIDVGGSVKFKGPMLWAPKTFQYNYQHLCPEFARWKPFEVLDCCAHDMWGAGCLMHRAFTDIAPWAFPLAGSGTSDCQTLNKLYEVWAQALTVPDAVATCAHPLLSNLQRAVPGRAYSQAATLLVQLLQPDMNTRATAQQALASQLFNST